MNAPEHLVIPPLEEHPRWALFAIVVGLAVIYPEGPFAPGVAGLYLLAVLRLTR